MYTFVNRAATIYKNIYRHYILVLSQYIIVKVLSISYNAGRTNFTTFTIKILSGPSQVTIAGSVTYSESQTQITDKNLN